MFIRKAMESVLKKFKICKIAPNRETSLKLPGTQCPRPFSALDTPLCPRFMPRPRAFFRNTYLLHDIGAASPVAPDFSITTAASDPSCGASIGGVPRFMGVR